MSTLREELGKRQLRYAVLKAQGFMSRINDDCGSDQINRIGREVVRFSEDHDCFTAAAFTAAVCNHIVFYDRRNENVMIMPNRVKWLVDRVGNEEVNKDSYVLNLYDAEKVEAGAKTGKLPNDEMIYRCIGFYNVV